MVRRFGTLVKTKGLEVIELETFGALERFPTREDFISFWSRMPGHSDYLSTGHAAVLGELAAQHQDENGFVVCEWCVVWQARKGRG